MGFHAYSSPYDWSRIAGFKATAKTVPGGMIDLSVGSPTLRPLSIHGSANCAGWI